MARVIFLGTPEYGATILAALVAAQHEVVAVVTQPDCLAGRGRHALQIPPVKRVALEHGIPVFQPAVLRRDRRTVAAMRNLCPDVLVLAAYGQILRPEVLSLARGGCIGVHASLLPRYRGAAPVAAAILAGDSETGVSLMLTDAGMDTGPIIAQERLVISPDDTTGTLTGRLARLGAELVVGVLPLWLNGGLVAHEQDDTLATYAPEIHREHAAIDWHRPAEYLARLVRAMQPWPGAFCSCGRATMKVLTAHVSSDWPGAGEPGTVVRLGREVGVITGKGVLVLDRVQLEGRREMDAAAFARGRGDGVGLVLGCPLPPATGGPLAAPG